MTKVISFMWGGIGNQLFCYAAAKRMAIINQAELVIDDVSGFVSDLKYNRNYELNHFNIKERTATSRERLEPFSRFRRKLLRVWNKHLDFETRSYIEQNGPDWDPRLLSYKPHKTTYLQGYWQSEGYFKDIEDIIRSDLSIIPPNDAENLSMADHIRSKVAVAVHLRFFERPDKILGINAPNDYYIRAINYMESLLDDSHYYIFSDKPNAVRDKLPLPDNRITIISHNNADSNAYADLWLMTQCQHFIIANSTFSWWGAWLGKNPNKKVIAPGFERRKGIMSWGFKGLLPEEWLKL